MVEAAAGVGGGEAVVVIWRAVFDLLPTEEPPGNGWAVWKVERGGAWFICERQADADEHTVRLPYIVDTSAIAKWLAPLQRRAERDNAHNLAKMLVLVQAALDAADEGFKAFERELAARKSGVSP